MEIVTTMKYRTCHMARHQGSIGNFTRTYGEVEAGSETEALDITRKQLEEAGLETAGGYADCNCNCHCGGYDGAGTCKQPCDDCQCDE